MLKGLSVGEAWLWAWSQSTWVPRGPASGVRNLCSHSGPQVQKDLV